MKRDLSNKRITVGVALASAIADIQAITESEARAAFHASPAIRWNGLDFGMKASDKIDDRSLDDDASAQLRGFTQYGGGVPVFWPKVTEVTGVLRQAYNLFKQQGTDLVWFERVGWGSTQDEFTAGDEINSYLITTDGFKPDTEGDGGYAYLLTMLARGVAYPKTIIAADAPAAVTVDGASTRAVGVGKAGFLRAHYLGNDVTKRATWRSDDETKVRVEKGIIIGTGAGTANVYATFPGGTESTALAVTAA